MNTNTDSTIVVTESTTLEEIVSQLDELGLIYHKAPIEKEFRWYYNETGQVYATCSNPADAEMYGFTGNYIIVDKLIFDNFIKYKIINGNPSLMKDDLGQRKQLEKSDSGFQVVKNNVALLLEAKDTYKDTEYYDYRNN